MTVLAAQAVVYDEPTRAHTLDGIPIPSVTQVLRCTGVTDFSHVDPLVLERKRLLGVAAHAATHYIDDGDLDWSTIGPAVEPYLRAWQRFLYERGFVSTLREVVVVSRTYHFCGRLDRFGRIAGENQRRILLDLKIGDPDAAAADLQLAGYEVALRESHPALADQLLERWSVRLLDDGRYRLERYPKPHRRSSDDKHDFLALARAVNVRQARRGGPPFWGLKD